MVRHIRSDESPHVEYLRTALSEIAARTLICEDGATVSGHEVVQQLIDRSLKFVIRQRREERRAQMHASIRASAKGIVNDIEDLIRRFDELETPWQTPVRFAA
jgi:hypothetical protein